MFGLKSSMLSCLAELLPLGRIRMLMVSGGFLALGSPRNHTNNDHKSKESLAIYSTTFTCQSHDNSSYLTLKSIEIIFA